MKMTKPLLTLLFALLLPLTAFANPFEHRLPNGLRVIVHTDRKAPIVAVNVWYHVGSKDEPAGRSGFAHLFEHLMFGGSVNIPDYDAPLQSAGGENNAWTNNDITSAGDSWYSSND